MNHKSNGSKLDPHWMQCVLILHQRRTPKTLTLNPLLLKYFCVPPWTFKYSHRYFSSPPGYIDLVCFFSSINKRPTIQHCFCRSRAMNISSPSTSKLLHQSQSDMQDIILKNSHSMTSSNTCYSWFSTIRNRLKLTFLYVSDKILKRKTRMLFFTSHRHLKFQRPMDGIFTNFYWWIRILSRLRRKGKCSCINLNQHLIFFSFT
jgi:hypothetical protein